MTQRVKGMLLTLAAISILFVGLNSVAEAGLFGFGGDSWQEEVLLHDGQKMIVERSQTYGGRHEVGQPSPIKEHTITFTVPSSSTRFIWTSRYGKELGRTNFLLLAVHVLNGIPYLVVQPNLCLSYNKWGRPNPPYVFFTYEGNAWQRIPLEAVPAEFTTLNVAISLDTRYVRDMVARRVVPAEIIKERNGQLTQPEFKMLLREPVKSGRGGASLVDCEERIRVKDGWISPGGSKAPSPLMPPGPIDATK